MPQKDYFSRQPVLPKEYATALCQAAGLGEPKLTPTSNEVPYPTAWMAYCHGSKGRRKGFSFNDTEIRNQGLSDSQWGALKSAFTETSLRMSRTASCRYELQSYAQGQPFVDLKQFPNADPQNPQDHEIGYEFVVVTHGTFDTFVEAKLSRERQSPHVEGTLHVVAP